VTPPGQKHITRALEGSGNAMLRTPCYAVASPTSELAPFVIDRREPRANDLLIDIDYCGICHSDIHQARDEWGGAIFPMVPGHEIVGRVSRMGEKVKGWKAGDIAGVSVIVDSCRQCAACRSGEEQYCERVASGTYNGYEQDGKTPTYGGYSTMITVDENFVLRIPPELRPERAAPLLCAGITTYSPLRKFGVKPGDRLGVVGLGGLGHMGVKLGKALGAEVTVLSHSPAKREDSFRLGAADFISTDDPGVFKANDRRFDFLLDTVSAAHDYNSYLQLLRNDGTMMLVGLPPASMLRPQAIIDRRIRIVGSSIGGMRETQEMLQFCAAHGVESDIELIRMQEVNEAFERMMKGDVRYRFVVGLDSLRDGSQAG
jgi:alcohol dehydrogenase (NADP+)